MILFFAVLLDFLLGEPRRWHPLVGFGCLADYVEKKFNHDKIYLGVLAWCLLILPVVFLTWFLAEFLGWWFEVLCAYLAIGAKSLRDHALQVYEALMQNNLNKARKKVGWIVSRDTAELNEEEVSKACIESVLENGNDAIFAALFWVLLAGAPGVILYRLSNTLDAMWGYKTPRFLYFGRFAARVDDILNWLPARLTAFSYLLAGNFKLGLHCWRTQARLWYSPNAGVVMAAGAGALNIQLGGMANYHGQLKVRPILGIGKQPIHYDIMRAWQLIFRTILIWILTTLLITLYFYLINPLII